MKRLNLFSCTLPFASILLLPGLAAAQSTEQSAPASPTERSASNSVELSDIIVTAQKRSEAVSRVGMSITAVSGETLSRLRVQTISDVVKLVPGLNVTQSFTGAPIFNLRGLSFETPSVSSAAPVGFYVDEIAYAYPYEASGPVYDLERVEVLKGPQGTLYGRNTTGGLVNFITAKPTADPHASLQFDVGNYDTLGAQGFVSGPISSTLMGRVAFFTTNSNKGWQKSVTRDDTLGEVDKKALRGELQWEPTSSFTALLSVNFWRDQSDTQAAQLAYYKPDVPSFALSAVQVAPDLLTSGAKNSQADWTPLSLQPAGDEGVKRRPYQKNDEFHSIALMAKYQISPDISVTSLTGYNHLRRQTGQSADGSQFQVYSLDENARVNSISEEIRLSGDTPRFNWLAGGYFEHDTTYENQLSYLNSWSLLDTLRFVATTLNDPRYSAQQLAEGFTVNNQFADIHSRTVSAFANAQYKVTDTIKLTAGARYTDDRSSNKGCAADSQGNTLPVWNTAVAALVGLYPNINVQPNQCITFATGFKGLSGLISQPIHEHNVAWRGAVDWTPSSNLLFYGSVSRGYKSGVFPVIPGNLETQYIPAKQEEVTSYEVGTKGRLGGIQATIAGYYNDYKGKQLVGTVADPVFTTLTRVLNIPKSKTYGLEGSVDWSVTPRLALRGSASYLRTKIITFTGFNPFGVIVNFAGDEFPNSPRLQAKGDITYVMPVSASLNLTGDLNATYQSRSSNDFQNLATYAASGGGTVSGRVFNIPAYGLINGSVSLSNSNNHWTASVWARNLNNHNYWTTVKYTIDSIVRYSGMPRTFGASIRYDF